MNIRSIKERAAFLLEDCKPQYIRILMIIMLIGLIPDMIPSTNQTFIEIITLLVSVLFLTWEHGIVVASLKVVRNNAQSLNDQDIYVGWTRIRDLFSTYFLSSFVVMIVSYGVSYALLMMFQLLLSSYIDLSLLMSMMVSPSTESIMYILNIIINSPSLMFVLLLIVIIDIIVSFVITAYVFAMPYLKEQYQMTARQSLKETFSLMSGHIWDLIKLELSFFGWMLLVVIVQALIIELLAFMPIFGSVIASIASTFLAVYTYLPRYRLSQAIFFEELAYYRYEIYQGPQGDYDDVE